MPGFANSAFGRGFGAGGGRGRRGGRGWRHLFRETGLTGWQRAAGQPAGISSVATLKERAELLEGELRELRQHISAIESGTHPA